jgi:hypothetical protein
LFFILHGSNPTRNKVTFLKVPGFHFAAKAVAQSLLAPCNTGSSLETIFLKERGIVMPQLILVLLIEGQDSR